MIYVKCEKCELSSALFKLWSASHPAGEFNVCKFCTSEDSLLVAAQEVPDPNCPVVWTGGKFIICWRKTGQDKKRVKKNPSKTTGEEDHVIWSKAPAICMRVGTHFSFRSNFPTNIDLLIFDPFVTVGWTTETLFTNCIL